MAHSSRRKRANTAPTGGSEGSARDAADGTAPGEGVPEQGEGGGPFAILQALALNAVPLIGIWLAGWSTATTLAVYWCENLIGALLVALRLVIHRQMTHARGYERNQLGIKSGSSDGPGTPIKRFIPEFLAGSLAFTLAHGIALAFVLFRFLPTVGGSQIDWAALKQGVLAVAVFQLLGFTSDLFALRTRSFAWARELAKLTIGRVMVVHLTLVLGCVFMFWLGNGAAFIGLFAVLKTLVDVGSVVSPRTAEPDERARDDERPSRR